MKFAFPQMRQLVPPTNSQMAKLFDLFGLGRGIELTFPTVIDPYKLIGGSWKTSALFKRPLSTSMFGKRVGLLMGISRPTVT